MFISDAIPAGGTLRERWPLVIGVLFALFGLDVLDVVLPSPASYGAPIRWLLLVGPNWLIAGVLIAGVVWIERREINSIGIRRPSRRDLMLSGVGFVLGVVAFGLTQPLVRALGLTSTQTGIGAVATLPTWVAVVIALTAGVTEEVLYRGYPIERIGDLTGKLWIGGAVTYAVFTIAHIPFWGVGGALQIGAWTLVVTVLYLRTRNLIACMLMHIGNDLFAFVVLPVVLEGGLIG